MAKKKLKSIQIRKSKNALRRVVNEINIMYITIHILTDSIKSTQKQFNEGKLNFCKCDILSA